MHILLMEVLIIAMPWAAQKCNNPSSSGYNRGRHTGTPPAIPITPEWNNLSIRRENPKYPTYNREDQNMIWRRPLVLIDKIPLCLGDTWPPRSGQTCRMGDIQVTSNFLVHYSPPRGTIRGQYASLPRIPSWWQIICQSPFLRWRSEIWDNG